MKHYTKQQAFVEGVRCRECEQLSANLWEALFRIRDGLLHGTPIRYEQALMARGLVAGSKLTAKGLQFAAVEWRDAK